MAIGAKIYHVAQGDPTWLHRGVPWNFFEEVDSAAGILRLVLDLRLGTVTAGGSFGMPFAIGGFVLDRFGSPRYPLLGSGTPRRRESCGMAHKGFRKHAIDGVGPAAIMLDDLVGDMRHIRNSLGLIGNRFK